MKSNMADLQGVWIYNTIMDLLILCEGVFRGVVKDNVDEFYAL